MTGLAKEDKFFWNGDFFDGFSLLMSGSRCSEDVTLILTSAIFIAV